MKLVGRQLVAILGGALFCTGTLAGGGYLTQIAPNPVRFDAWVEPKDPTTALPPLPMSDTSETNSVAQTETSTVENSAPEQVPILIQTPEPIDWPLSRRASLESLAEVRRISIFQT